MHVHAEGRDEAQPQVVTQRPGVGVGAEVPAHQGSVHRGVGQNRLSARVEVVDVHGAAVLMEVQSPKTTDCGESGWSTSSSLFLTFEP